MPATATAPTYDLDAARKDGVGDDEIMQHLAATRGYDLDNALKDGVPKDEIIQHLIQKPYHMSAYWGQPGQAQTGVAPNPVSIPGPGAGDQSGLAFGTSGMTSPAPPVIHQGLFQPNFQQQFAGDAYKAKLEIMRAEATAKAQAEAMTGRMEDVEKAKLANEREARRQLIKDMQDAGEWDKLNSSQQAQVRTEGKLTLVKPFTEDHSTSGDDILRTNPYATDVFHGPVMHGRAYTLQNMGDGTFNYIPNLDSTRPIWLPPEPGDPQGMFRLGAIDTKTNQMVGPTRATIPPAGYLPKTQIINGIQMVQQPDNSFAPVPTTSFQTSVPLIPGAAGVQTRPGAGGGSTPARNPSPTAPAPQAKPGGGRQLPVPPPPLAQSSPSPGGQQAYAGQPGAAVGGKGITPEEKQAMKTQAIQIDKTIGTLGSVQKNMGLLNSMITAGKLNFMMEPGGLLKSFVARNVKLTEPEAKLAADFTSLAESINELRGPLGGTVSRGAPAFMALQAQKGDLLANPDLTRQVLANTMDDFIQQRDVLDQGIHYGLPKPPGSDRVRVLLPDGLKTATAPREQLSSLFSQGYHRVPMTYAP